jgi:hypothetical protein
VSIDTNSEYRGDSPSINSSHRHPATLVPSGEYWFGKQEIHTTYDDLKEFAIHVLNNELQAECEQFIDIPILEIKVRSVYEGSIELFFTVLFGVVADIAGIKNLYDSIDFLRTLAEKKLEKRFKEEYGDYFRINVNRQIPRDTHYYEDYELFHKRRGIPLRSARNDERPKRDGFFYYLLVSNIALLAIIIALVASAVVKVYF